MSDQDFDEGVAAARDLAEREIDTVLRESGILHVAFERGGLGSTYECARGRVSRYVAFKVARFSDPDPYPGIFPDRNEIYFSFRFGQGWNWNSVSKDFAKSHKLIDEPEAVGEHEFDGARVCDLAFVVRNAQAWLCGWGNSGVVHGTKATGEEWPGHS